MVRWALLWAMACGAPAAAQYIPFTSGPIPLCDTSTFTANVTGVGTLVTPNAWNTGYYLDDLLVNITSDHPQTLKITLTSPQGTTLVLSAFNGAGGQNYTNTHFTYYGWNNITTAAAPFTNYYYPQGGTFDVFTGQNGNGTWTITVIDTACANGGTGPGGTWTPGWFQGGTNSGAFAFGFSSGPPPPCTVNMGSQSVNTCQTLQPVDLISGFQSTWNWDAGSWVDVYDNSWNLIAPPYVVSTPGTYYIYVYDWLSACSYDGYFYINALPSINLGPDQVVEQCSGAGPVNLTALFNLSGATQHSWTLDGAPITNASATAATAPGVYVITAMNNGCSDMAQVTLSNAATPVLGPDQALTICQGSSADLTALFDTQGLTADWSAGGIAIAPPTAATSSGTYTVSVTTAAGCTDVADAVLTVQAPPALGADQVVSLCSGSTVDLTPLFPTAGLGTAWTLGGAAVPAPGAVSAAGTYQLVATDAASCTDTAFVTVNVQQSPSLGSDAAAAICAGESVDLTAFYSTAGLSAAWTLAGAPVADPAAVSAAGAYTLTVTDANGCSDAAIVTVTVAANPVLGADQQYTICDGATLNLTALYAAGANTLSWTLNGTPVPNPEAVGTSGAYTLTATNAAGCTSNATVTLTVNPSPALGGDQMVAICEGGSFDLEAVYSTAGLSGIWSHNGVAVADPSAVTEAGSYRLVVANGWACTDTAWVMLTVNPNPQLGDDQFFSLCPWQTVDLSTVFPVSGMTAIYLLDGQPVDDPYAVADSGTYAITVTDANGCMDEAMATVVEVECLCVADFDVDARCLQEPARFTLLADSVVVSALWDFGDAASPSTEIDPMVRFAKEEEVRVMLQATLTCGVVVVERTVPIVDCSDSCKVWVPNAFTPNSDDRNDAWTWYGECMPEDFTMLIYDRWGGLVYSTTDPADGWDGSAGGSPAPDGVYAYRMGYRLTYQKHRWVSGYITLLR